VNQLTLEGLLAAIAACEREPIGEWMRSQGFPPERSLLLLPSSYRALLAPIRAPRYVRFSEFVKQPLLSADVLRPSTPLDRVRPQ
jgi:hypothetical protein